MRLQQNDPFRQGGKMYLAPRHIHHGNRLLGFGGLNAGKDAGCRKGNAKASSRYDHGDITIYI